MLAVAAKTKPLRRRPRRPRPLRQQQLQLPPLAQLLPPCPPPLAMAAEPTATPLATTRAPETRPQADATPTPVPAATRAPATPAPAANPKITRVRMSNTVPLNESNRTWVGGWPNLVQNDPYGETLIENHEVTSEPIPAMAKSWEVGAGFNTWTFELNEGIPWHFGYGEFTAADVAHTWELMTREDSASTFKATWLKATAEIHDDYSVSFHFEEPQLSGGRLFSRLQGDLVILSKAQWDEAGGDPSAYDDRPTGTGSYQYGGRRLGETVWYEKIDYEHWAGENPDFQELEWVWAAEQFTRLSALLAGEVQGADLSREVQVDAKARGMKVVSSNNENNQSYGFFGGTYLSTVDSNLEPWPGGKHPHYTGEEPWHNPVVREAFNRAVDRQAIIDEVYFGNASSVYVPVFAPFTEGWSDRWVTEFDDKYAYDPDRAIQLLADAGYGPGDISIGMSSTVIPGNPEIPQLIEILSTMWEAVGIDTTIQDVRGIRRLGANAIRPRHPRNVRHSPEHSHQDHPGRPAGLLGIRARWPALRLGRRLHQPEIRLPGKVLERRPKGAVRQGGRGLHVR